ncbi:MAG: sodium:solute symporter family protein [Tunicatimonas sp.]|uniref:sodium:solute symporter family protein n=1 Tax=Tunicatimonas sp. TaxID=1940096 RepID=UPI003C762E85
MQLATLDWVIVGAYFLFVLIVGLVVSRKAGDNVSEFFLSGRNMPWWLLGVSMVATTFSADTPNLVTGLVRVDGVAGNWAWWAFLLTGMLTVFVFAKLWRRSMVLTDVEFYELRYSGKAAAFLRGFRALYLGLVFNVVVMGAVSLAAIKFGEIVLGLPGWLTLLIAGSITLAYSTFGGLKAVVITDFVQFILAMIGSIWACIYLVNHERVGGLSKLLSDERVLEKTQLLPDFSDPSVWVPILLVPLAVQWWASYYPGAEPGGGGYIAQRMFSAKNERNAIGATLFFNIAHYSLRPWPWILIALASIVVFPELTDIQRVFPALSADKLGDDVAYPAMLTLLPVGLLGLVAASLIAAFMSTISTQLNLGASYLVNDFYQRFINPNATQRQLIWAARLVTVFSAFLGLGLGLLLTDASQAFDLLLLLGAGTGLIYILRWFWWRINAMTEIIAMIVSLIIASFFTFAEHGLESWQTIVIGSLLTTIIWIVSAFLTRPTDDETLINFYRKIKPGGKGWNAVITKAKAEGVVLEKEPGQLPLELLCVLIGSITVYTALFSTGNWIYGNSGLASIFTVVAIAGGAFLFWAWKRLRTE